jgi:hypothetical protein
MENKYAVVVRPVAGNQLAKHIEFLARKSVKAASEIVDNFEKLEFALSTNPTSFPAFYKNYRKAIIQPRYAVLFEVEDSSVFIDKILDMRQLEYNDIINELADVDV